MNRITPHAQADVSQAAYLKTDQNRRVGIARVLELCGDVSEMSIWRWSNDARLNFPKPIYIGRRRYWKESEIVAWLDAQPQQAA